MQSFAGERIFPLPPEQLWPKLRDAAFLVSCIPDGTPQPGATRDKGVCTVRPGFSFASGSLDITIEVIDGQEPTSLRFTQKSKGVGTTSEVETSLTIAPHEQGSKVVWNADIKSLGGLLKMVPAGLIRGAANKVIEDVWTGVAAKVNDEKEPRTK
jgi:carbon monoxide dehydrogenase subunit G